MKTTKVVIEFKLATVTWNITAGCLKAVGPVARAFNMTVPEFLEAKTRNTLPNQIKGRMWDEVHPMPKGFSVEIGDPVWQSRLEAAARYEGRTVQEEVWRDIIGYLECIYEDTIRHPETLEIICDGDVFNKFRTHAIAAKIAA